jgi:hypothetical protein
MTPHLARTDGRKFYRASEFQPGKIYWGEAMRFRVDVSGQVEAYNSYYGEWHAVKPSVESLFVGEMI